MSKIFRTLNKFMLFIFCAHAPLDPRCSIPDLGLFVDKYGSPIEVELFPGYDRSKLLNLDSLDLEERVLYLNHAVYALVFDYIFNTRHNIPVNFNLAHVPMIHNTTKSLCDETTWIKIRNAALVNLFLQNYFNEDPRLADVFDYIDFNNIISNPIHMSQTLEIFGYYHTDKLLNNSFTAITGPRADFLEQQAIISITKSTRKEFYEEFIEKITLYTNVLEAIILHCKSNSGQIRTNSNIMKTDYEYYAYYLDILVEAQIYTKHELYKIPKDTLLIRLKNFLEALKKIKTAERSAIKKILLSEQEEYYSIMRTYNQPELELIRQELLADQAKRKAPKGNRSDAKGKASTPAAKKPTPTASNTTKSANTPSAQTNSSSVQAASKPQPVQTITIEDTAKAAAEEKRRLKEEAAKALLAEEKFKKRIDRLMAKVIADETNERKKIKDHENRESKITLTQIKALANQAQELNNIKLAETRASASLSDSELIDSQQIAFYARLLALMSGETRARASLSDSELIDSQQIAFYARLLALMSDETTANQALYNTITEELAALKTPSQPQPVQVTPSSKLSTPKPPKGSIHKTHTTPPPSYDMAQKAQTAQTSKYTSATARTTPPPSYTQAMLDISKKPSILSGDNQTIITTSNPSEHAQVITASAQVITASAEIPTSDDLLQAFLVRNSITSSSPQLTRAEVLDELTPVSPDTTTEYNVQSSSSQTEPKTSTIRNGRKYPNNPSPIYVAPPYNPRESVIAIFSPDPDTTTLEGFVDSMCISTQRSVPAENISTTTNSISSHKS